MSPFALSVAPPLQAGAVVWSLQGTLYATVIVKASYRVAGDGSLAPVDADLLGPGELVPFVERAQLVMVTTFPRSGMGRAAVQRAGALVLDKRVRHGNELGPRPPTLTVDPARIISLPGHVDRAAFQMAAPDQLFDHVLAGDRIVLDNLDASAGLRMLLVPGDHPVVTATLAGHSLEVPMRCDTVLVDDRPRLSLVWRGPFTLPNEAAILKLSADVRLHTAAATASSSDAALQTIGLPEGEALSHLMQPAADGTVGIDADAAPSAPATPFGGGFKRPRRQNPDANADWKVGAAAAGPVDPTGALGTMFVPGAPEPLAAPFAYHPSPQAPAVLDPAPQAPPRAPVAEPELLSAPVLPAKLDKADAPVLATAFNFDVTVMPGRPAAPPTPAPVIKNAPAEPTPPPEPAPKPTKQSAKAALLKKLRRK